MTTYHEEFGFDLGPQFEDFVAGAAEAAREFGRRLRDMGCGSPTSEFDPLRHVFGSDEGSGPRGSGGPERLRYYYPYPPANIYKDREGGLVLQFALAGFAESAISVAFQDDWLVLTAKAPEPAGDEESRYERRSYRPRDIDRQRYFVPADEYDQAAASAVFKNGALTVTVPARDIAAAGGIKIEIVKEGS